MLTSTEISSQVARVGHEPTENIRTMEDHVQAYDTWTAAGVRDRILVHIDGHLDFDWIADRSPEELLAAGSSAELDRLLTQVSAWNLDGRPPRERVTSANFIYSAIRDGLVREFFWVMPDPLWAQSKRRVIRRGLEKKIRRRRPTDTGPIRASDHSITLTLLGCSVVLCTLEQLPRFSEAVLLDIDVDYLVTSRSTGPAPYFERQPAGPWLWPTAFLERLRLAQLPTDLVTIAYSVNGGYTPLRYKYFGDLLQRAIRDPRQPVSDQPPVGSAAEALEEITRAWKQGSAGAAREWWSLMVNRDASYRTVYATPGWREEQGGRWASALSIYRQMVQVEPSWHVPHLGLGRAFWHFGRYAEAERAFVTARSLSAAPTSATRWLGLCAFRHGEWEAAHRHWTRAVKEDPQEVRSWYGLARLEARRGNFAIAIEHANRCVTLGWHGPSVHWLLARAAWRVRQRRLARREFNLWVRRLPLTLLAAGLTLWRQIQRRARVRHAQGNPAAGAEADASVV